MPAEPGDVAFADFPSVTKRHYASPGLNEVESAELADDLSPWDRAGKLERETGIEPATLSLGSFRHNRITPCFAS